MTSGMRGGKLGASCQLLLFCCEIELSIEIEMVLYGEQAAHVCK